MENSSKYLSIDFIKKSLTVELIISIVLYFIDAIILACTLMSEGDALQIDAFNTVTIHTVVRLLLALFVTFVCYSVKKEKTYVGVLCLIVGILELFGGSIFTFILSLTILVDSVRYIKTIRKNNKNT